ncbi:hypothetical protein BC940DRAFT_316901 [Gongronella butleri]|nr:hypothetical protein BC940DRAFT_316901 [Gongronella butleri]
MGGLLSKERTDPNDYEKVLSELDGKIQKAELRLTEIKLRQRRTGVLWVIYATLVWLVYVVYCFFTLQDAPMASSTFQAAPIVITPVGIYYMRKALTWFYAKKQSSEESHLSSLRAQQRLKVEELKKKTSYYTTQSLLERYDAEAVARKKQQQQQQQLMAQQQKQQELRQRKPVSAGPTMNRPMAPQGHMTTFKGGDQVRAPAFQQHQAPMITMGGPGAPAAAPRGPPQWYDKLIDALVGEDGPETKYALICQHCFMHNGLILPTEVETIQYTCPHCKKFNPSRQSRQLHPDGPVLPIVKDHALTPQPKDTTSSPHDDHPRAVNGDNDRMDKHEQQDTDDIADEHDPDSIASRVRQRHADSDKSDTSPSPALDTAHETNDTASDA